MQAEHILVRRTGYTHHGLYIGNGRVIHFSGENNSKTQAKIIETSITNFSNGGTLQKIIYKKSLPIEESYQRALNAIGEKKYSLIFNNCEHFATWCKTGKHKSKQVDAVKNLIMFRVVAKPLLALISFSLILPKLIALGYTAKSMMGYAYILGVEPFEP